MQVVSEEFMDSLNGSIKPIVTVDVWRDGRLLAGNLPVSGGQVTITAGQAIRSKVQVSFLDGTDEYPAGSLVPRRPEDPLHPLGGSILHLSAGLRLAQRDEMVPLGRFVPVDADPGEETFKIYSRPGGSDAVTANPTTTTVECSDLARKVQNDKFISVEQPAAGTNVSAEMGRILRDAGMMWQPPAGMPNRSVPGDIAYDADRLDAWWKLAGVVQMEPIFRPDGRATLQSPTLGTPVWTVQGGPDGGLITVSRTAKMDGFYNCVVATGATEGDKLPVRAVATLDEGPSRFGGPLGRIVYYYSSPLITTQADATAAAQTRLANLVRGRTLEVPVTCAWNPALEVGDTVLLVLPSGGSLPGRVVEITWPLLPGPMQLKVAVSPDALGNA